MAKAITNDVVKQITRNLVHANITGAHTIQIQARLCWKMRV